MAHVTIPDQDSYVVYASQTGTGPFTVPFAVFEKADITVLVAGVDIGQAGFSYAATSSTTGGYQTGTITLTASITSQDVTIYRQINPKRTSDIGVGPQNRDAQNSAFDRIHAQLQDNQRDFTRAPLLPVGSNEGALPTPEVGKALGWASGGWTWLSELVSTTVSSFMATPLVAASAHAFAKAVDGSITLQTRAGLQALTSPAGNVTYNMRGGSAATDRAGGTFFWFSGDQSALCVASTKTVSAVDIGADTLTVTAHGWVSGQAVIATAADAGLSLDTVYYAARIDANTISLHTSIVAALAGTSKVNITALVGSLSLKALFDPKQAMYVIPSGLSRTGSDGCYVRAYDGEVHATWWELDVDGATNNAEELNNFLFFVCLVGGDSVICNGAHYVTSKLVVNESLVTSDYDITRVNIRGEGMGNTQIICAHAGNGIEYLGGASGGLGAYVKWSDLRLRGSGQAGGVGIRADNAAWFHLENVAVTEFDKHFNFTDVLSTVVDACVIRFGYEAGDFAYSDASRPNAIAFRDTITGAHYERGWLVTGAASFTYRGGTMEGNGNIEGTVFVGGYGIKAVDCGVEGMSGLNIEGTYFEYQADTADIWITHASGNVMHKISGCGFARIDSTVRVTNNILFERAGGSSEIWLGGNGFGALGSYTESTARPYIAAPSGSIIDAGNYWNSDTAKPDPIIFKASATEDIEYRYQRLEDDFLGDAIDAKWNTRLGTDPQASIAHGGSLLRGLVILTSGDDAAASMAVNGAQFDQGATQWRMSQGGFDMYVRAYVENITNVCVFIGMTDQVAALEMPFTMSGTTLTSNATNGFGVLFDTDATTDNWKLVGVKADVDATTQDAGVAPVANITESWRMAADAAGNVTFFRNGAIIGTVLSNAVTASTLLTPVIAIFSRTAASRVTVLDYIRLRALR